MAGIQQLLGDLKRAFPRQKIELPTVEIYARELADLPETALEVAARELIRSSEFFPTIAAIRQAAVTSLLALPSEAEALAQIEARVAWGRSQVGTCPAVETGVHQAVLAVGGYYAFRASEDPGVVRGQFLRLYRDGCARRIRELQVNGFRALSGQNVLSA